MILNNRNTLGKLILNRTSIACISLAVVPLVHGVSLQGIQTNVDGRPVIFDGTQPMMVNSHVMVPVRGIFEHMNSRVDWDQSSRTVIAHHGRDYIEMRMNNPSALKNGQTIWLDSPVMMSGGSAMVPLRALSEMMGAAVEWDNNSQTVDINTIGTVDLSSPINDQQERDRTIQGQQNLAADQAQVVLLRQQNDNNRNDHNRGIDYRVVNFPAGTVLPFRLQDRLSSSESRSGDRFTAKLDTTSTSYYQGLPSSITLEGHVSSVQRRRGNRPGVLGLAFDRLRTVNGQVYAVQGSLIGLDNKSVENKNGRLVARPKASDNNLKYVGYGAGAGALISVLTKTNLVTDAIIGGALGYLLGQSQHNRPSARDVVAEGGTTFGVRLKRSLSIHVSPIYRG